MMNSFNRTKIVATVGPASQSEEMIETLMNTGVSVFRLNFSHGKHDVLRPIIETIRNLNTKLNKNVAILADLQGPKIRLGEIEGGSLEVKKGDTLYITTDESKTSKDTVFLSYQDFCTDVKSGDIVLVDDGKIELEVLDSNGKDKVKMKVLISGTILPRKGVNLPDTKISIPSLTEKDLADLEFATDMNVDWIALSFVRSPKDLIQLKGILNYKKSRSRVIAKIEKPQAIEHLDAIIEETDGVMIARGDLGVELPMEQVPIIQKKIVDKCLKASKPVIIATQMMESMITNSKPTRAEVTDVANAIMDGADAVMLSGETAVGANPEKVIEIMQRIIEEVEKDDRIYNKDLKAETSSTTYLSDAICYSACRLTLQVDAKAIMGMTRSGYTAFRVSSFRPKARVFVFSDNRDIITTLNLVWGVKGFYYDKMVSTDETIDDLHNLLKEQSYLKSGDIVINMASMPIHKQARTNMVKISQI